MQIVVLGMHRSGTSVTARILNLMGLYFGPEGISTGANNENKKGFWERKDVRQLNDFILQKNSFDWYKVSGYDIGKLSKETINEFHKKAGELILEIDAHRPWFIKEPRLCLNFELWKRQLEVPIVIYVYRDPVEVAKSLQIRNGFPLDYGLALWEKYNRTALRQSKNISKTFINYNELIKSPKKVIDELTTFLKSKEVPVRELSDKEITNFLDPKLYRQRGDESLEVLLSKSQHNLYEALKNKTEYTNGSLSEAELKLSTYEKIFENGFKYKGLEKEFSILKNKLHEAEKEIGKLIKSEEKLEEFRFKIFETSNEFDKERREKDSLKQELNRERDKKERLEKEFNKEKERIREELNGEMGKKEQVINKLHEEREANRRIIEELYKERKEKELIIKEFNKEREEKEQLIKKFGQEKIDKSRLKAKYHQKIEDQTHSIKVLQRAILDKDKSLAESWNRIQDMRLKNRFKSVFGLYHKEAIDKEVSVNSPPLEPKKKTQSKIYSTEQEIYQNKLFSSITISEEEPFLIKREYEDLSFCNLILYKDELIEQFIKSKTPDKINIVIPIYNNTIDLKKCIDSIYKYTIFPFHLILINDCSTEIDINTYLKTIKSKKEITVIENHRNMGFVKSANIGLKYSQNDVVLLNSDTEVTPRWLLKLLFCAYSENNIATVTPLSNASGAFSVPQIGVNKPIPPHLTTEEFARIVENQDNNKFFEVPTGNGFCLYIKRRVLKEVGYFNEDLFGRGYGEENDFCMRCIKAGFKNMLISNLYIYHKGSTSFGEEKEKLYKKNRTTLNKLHPEYTELVQNFVSNIQINNIRHQIGHDLNDTSAISIATKRNLLIVLHEGGGGVPNTTKDLVKVVGRQYNTFILTSDSKKLLVKAVINGHQETISEFDLSQSWDPSKFYDQEYEKVVLNVMLSLNIDIVHIRHLFKHYLDLPKICIRLAIPYVLSFHDYYFASPSINLLDSKGKYRPNTNPVPWHCPSPLLQNLPNSPEFLIIWKKVMFKIISNASQLISTSNSVKAFFTKEYNIEQIPFNIIPHGRDFDYETSIKADKIEQKQIDLNNSNKLKILCLGNIDYHKGSSLIAEIHRIDHQNRFEFHFAGSIDKSLEGVGKYHGKYQRSDLESIITRINPHIGMILSIWPETFCHTLTEMWYNGLPVLGINLGAIGERLKETGAGWLISGEYPDEIIVTMNKILNDKKEYSNKINNLKNITFTSVNKMAFHYLDIYDAIVSKQKKSQVGIFTPGSGFGGSSYVRVYLPYSTPKITENFNFHLLNGLDEKELVEYISKFDINQVIVQRNALSESQYKILAKNRQIIVYLEIDDDLFSMDESHPEFITYSPQIKTLDKIARRSNAIIVSSRKLKECLQTYEKPLVLQHNFLDEKIWCTPKLTEKKINNKVKLGYFGTYTHENDFEILRSIIPEIKKQLDCDNIDIKLEVVGVTKKEYEWFSRVEIPPGCNEYPNFVNWLRSLSWDIGLAPLEDNNINRSKSHIKYLEYAALGIPGIYSDIGEYSEIIKHDKNGKIANNKEEWINSIIDLVKNKNLRSKIAKNSYSDLISNHLLKNSSLIYNKA